MSISKAYFSEKLLVSCVKIPLSLEEQLLTASAIQLAQCFEIRKVIFRLSNSGFGCPYSTRSADSLRKEWEESIERQSSDICETLLLPQILKTRLIIRIRLIALQLLTWAAHNKKLFDIPYDLSAYFWMTTDWTIEGRLKEKEIAERLVQDESIPIFPRYRIACVYCLERFIFFLWDQMSVTDRSHLCFYDDIYGCPATDLIKLWSYYLEGNVHKLIDRENRFWYHAFSYAVEAAEREAVIRCWKQLSEREKQELIIVNARIAAYQGMVTENSEWISFLLSDFNVWRPLPVHSADILCFLLSEMCEKQRVSFLREFESTGFILLCFLEWPYQDFFMPIMNKFLNTLNILAYENLLLKVAQKYIDINKIENRDYDYGRLLIDLLEQIPEPFKRYIFTRKQEKRFSEGENLFFEIAKKQPFEYKDMRILQRILHETTVEEKHLILYSNSKVKLWEAIIHIGNLEVVNWLLTQCLPEGVIVNFKKIYFRSRKGHFACFYLLKNGKENSANLFLEWAALSTTEISEFKSDLFFDSEFQALYEELMYDFQEDNLNRIMKWCLVSIDAQKQFKEHLAQKRGKDICLRFLQQAKWKELAQFLIWCLASEETIEEFKKRLFPEIAIDIHYCFTCDNRWHDAELLFQWFRLSLEAINQLKEETLFLYARKACTPYMLLKYGWQRPELILRWCCSDEETVMAFKNQLEQMFEKLEIIEDKQCLVQGLNVLVKTFLCDLGSKQHVQE